MDSPHISPIFVARATKRRCGAPHNPMCQRHIGGEVRAGVVYSTFSGPPGVRRVTVRFAVPHDCMDVAAGAPVGGIPLRCGVPIRRPGGPTLRGRAMQRDAAFRSDASGTDRAGNR